MSMLMPLWDATDGFRSVRAMQWSQPHTDAPMPTTTAESRFSSNHPRTNHLIHYFSAYMPSGAVDILKAAPPTLPPTHNQSRIMGAARVPRATRAVSQHDQRAMVPVLDTCYEHTLCFESRETKATILSSWLCERVVTDERHGLLSEMRNAHNPSLMIARTCPLAR
ncbi:hypothetical protein BDV97DRAFT_14761 [Delphinella strobiligena]|nr:hypothetical protein BDV97DRAFT_14761 [Delphinella strobiligena]